MSVLVGFAGEHGSTREVAERVAQRLTECGYTTDLQPLGTAQVFADHDAAVVGSAVHNGAWLPPAEAFVERHSLALAERPVWMFSVGMTAAMPGPMRRLAERGEQPPVARLRELLGPRGYRRFSGVILPAHLNRWGRFLFRLLGCRYGGYRDWAAVDAWADDIARSLAASRTG